MKMNAKVLALRVITTSEEIEVMATGWRLALHVAQVTIGVFAALEFCRKALRFGVP